MATRKQVAKAAATQDVLIPGDVKDMTLARDGKARIEWAERNMPVLRAIRARFAKERPLKGLRIAACLHVKLRPRTWLARCRPAAPRCSCAARTRSRRRMTSPRR